MIGESKNAPSIWLPHVGVLFALSACAGGCSWIPNALGMHDGHLTQAQDVLALPGEKVVLRVRLESGSFLRDERNRTVRFIHEGQTHAVALTDREGFAEAVFVPPSAGDYRFVIEVPGAVDGGSWPQGRLLVSCRQPGASFVVVDLDGTLMEPDFKAVLTGDPKPLPEAVDVLQRLAQRDTILYLTHRPEFFGPKSKDWLTRHGFPAGPVLLSELTAFVNGSLRYKTQRLQDIRTRFSGMTFGIGDQITDVLAYRANGLKAVLIYHVSDPQDAEDVREQAVRLGELPQDVQVVHDWTEVRAALLEGKQFPPGRMKEDLLQRAAQLKPRWKLW